MTYSCYCVWEVGLWIAVTRCARQRSSILLLLTMVKVGGLCMWLAWLVWDNLRLSSGLSILIALSIKQRRQLGDSGRAQHCRNPLVYFLSYSALFVYSPPSPPPLSPAPRPPSLSAMTTQKAREMGRGGEEWRREQKREKGEHLVCRALISTALGEQALPTFPHKNTCTNTHARSQSLTHSVMVGHLPAPPWGWKEGMCSADYSGSGCLREWQCVERCATVGQSIIHTPRSAFQWFLPEKREPKCQATGKGFLSWESYMSAHSHIQVGCMIHIQAE